MKIDLPEIYTTPFESQKLDEQHFAAQYENPTAMLACWLECRSTIKDMIMNQLSDNEVLQSLENVRAIWPQSTILQKETANLRVIFSDPLNTPEAQKKIRADNDIYLSKL